MIDRVDVLVSGARGIEDITKLLPNISRLVSTAVRSTTTRGYEISRKEILRRISFPKGYLEGRSSRGKRFDKSVKGTGENTEGLIAGRFAPTSLARFVTNRAALTGGRGALLGKLTVMVTPGSRKKMKRAMLLNLKNGNVGVATILKPGEGDGKHEWTAPNGTRFRFLYGPSIDQVFRIVAEQKSDEIGAFMATKFLEGMK